MNQFEQKPVNVVNNLTSDSTTDALSATQGKALNSKIGSMISHFGADADETKTVNVGDSEFMLVFGRETNINYSGIYAHFSAWPTIIPIIANPNVSCSISDGIFTLVNNTGYKINGILIRTIG